MAAVAFSLAHKHGDSWECFDSFSNSCNWVSLDLTRMRLSRVHHAPIDASLRWRVLHDCMQSHIDFSNCIFFWTDDILGFASLWWDDFFATHQSISVCCVCKYFLKSDEEIILKSISLSINYTYSLVRSSSLCSPPNFDPILVLEVDISLFQGHRGLIIENSPRVLLHFLWKHAHGVAKAYFTTSLDCSTLFCSYVWLQIVLVRLCNEIPGTQPRSGSSSKKYCCSHLFPSCPKTKDNWDNIWHKSIQADMREIPWLLWFWNNLDQRVFWVLEVLNLATESCGCSYFLRCACLVIARKLLTTGPNFVRL